MKIGQIGPQVPSGFILEDYKSFSQNLLLFVRSRAVTVFETIAIAIAAVQPCDKLNHLKADLQKVLIANVSRFRKVRFQIPTIIKFFFRARSLRTTTNRCLPLRTFRQSWFRRQNIDRQQQFAENWRLKTCRKIGATFQKASNYRQSWKCRKSDGR